MPTSKAAKKNLKRKLRAQKQQAAKAQTEAQADAAEEAEKAIQAVPGTKAWWRLYANHFPVCGYAPEHLIERAAAGQPEAVREEARKGMRCLARKERPGMLSLGSMPDRWGTCLFTCLFDGVAAGQPEAVREQALCALVNLTRNDANQRSMWQNVEVRTCLIDGAAAGQLEEVREPWSLLCLEPCALVTLLRKSMWQFLLRALALRALAGLASEPTNQRSMWKKAEVRTCLIDGAAAGQPEEVCKQALRALANLAKEEANEHLDGWMHLDDLDERLLAALDRLNSHWTSISAAELKQLLEAEGLFVSEKRTNALKAKALQVRDKLASVSSAKAAAAGNAPDVIVLQCSNVKKGLSCPTHGKSTGDLDATLLAALDRLNLQWSSISAARIRSLLQAEGFVVSEKRTKALKARHVAEAA